MKTVGPALQYLFAVRGDQDSIPHCNTCRFFFFLQTIYRMELLGLVY